MHRRKARRISVLTGATALALTGVLLPATSGNVAKLTSDHFAIQVCKKLGKAVAWADVRYRSESLKHYAALRGRSCASPIQRGRLTSTVHGGQCRGTRDVDWQSPPSSTGPRGVARPTDMSTCLKLAGVYNFRPPQVAGTTVSIRVGSGDSG
jgi:hypothetical protein